MSTPAVIGAFFGIAAGMFLGAWIAARGFEKSLIQMMEEHDALRSGKEHAIDEDVK